MRLRHIPGSEETVAESPYVISDPASVKGKASAIFGNAAPVKIEIGCGKGRFITGLAAADPASDYIGIERYSSVLLYALKKLEENDIHNLRFICADACGLDDYFAPGEVDEIYLNFPDPWPKDRHAGRRLTSPGFLARYRTILKKEGRLEFKTDDRDLFDYSLSALRDCGWNILSSTTDMYAGGAPEGNIATEYEIRFLSQGIPICCLSAVAG